MSCQPPKAASIPSCRLTIHAYIFFIRVARLPQVSNAVGFRAYSTEPPAVPLGEHATGLELKELKAEAEGRDYFDHFDFLKQVGVGERILTVS